jgi:uncharacterized protein
MSSPLTQNQVLRKTRSFVRNSLGRDCTGHDAHHAFRVERTAALIARDEGARVYVVRLAALLHDIKDWKFHGGDDTLGKKAASKWLRSLGVSAPLIRHVSGIVSSVSFKGAGVRNSPPTLEGRIVQDADRLDALGAVGIARAFAYGGACRRPLHDPAQKPRFHENFEEYRTQQSTTVNHFHEKLLLLAKGMHTPLARMIAHKRHRFMKRFIERFMNEWDGIE